MFNFFEKIDSYCERIDFSYFSEPFNLISNIGFLGSGFFIWLMLKEYRIKHLHLFALNIIIFVIGTGSALFHSFATQWSMILDVVPIGVFIIYYLGFWCRTYMNFSIKKTIVTLAAWFFVTALSSIFLKDLPLGGSQTYFGVALFLPWMGWVQYRKYKYEYLIGATVVFWLSLFLRSIDPYICTYFQLGSHFLWHLLNSILLYLAMTNLILLHTRLKSGHHNLG